MLLTTVIGAESLPLVCDKCHHISVPHLPEQNHTAVYSRMPLASISGVSDTAVASVFKWPDVNS